MLKKRMELQKPGWDASSGRKAVEKGLDETRDGNWKDVKSGNDEKDVCRPRCGDKREGG